MKTSNTGTREREGGVPEDEKEPDAPPISKQFPESVYKYHINSTYCLYVVYSENFLWIYSWYELIVFKVYKMDIYYNYNGILVAVVDKHC